METLHEEKETKNKEKKIPEWIKTLKNILDKFELKRVSKIG